MRLKTKEFQEAANTILIAAALDKAAANLELRAKNNALYLTVTNKEYYCSVKFLLETNEEFYAVVDAKLFLDLIAGLTVPEFTLTIKNNVVVVGAGKSSYKLAMIYEGENLLTLAPIVIHNKTVEMPISLDTLKSILNTNGKDLAKIKNLDTDELHKLYYITEEGCFTFTNGATLNSFTLERPIKILLNDRIVKLFKLFKDDVNFSFGYDTLSNGIVQTKVIFQTQTVYIAALITCDDILLNRLQRPIELTKHFINEPYSNIMVISANTLSAAISRLMLFTKNSFDKTNMLVIPATVELSQNEITIKDSFENTEIIALEDNSEVDEGYTMKINLADLKVVLDSCKNEYITIKCGNHQSVVIVHNLISSLIPEDNE